MSKFPDDWEETAWNKLPVSIKQRAILRLRAVYDEEFFTEISKLIDENGLGEWIPDLWHFGQGMTVRNVLRSNRAAQAVNDNIHIEKISTPILDAELPALPEIYQEVYGDAYQGEEYGNWDDYYIQCIEAAASKRAF